MRHALLNVLRDLQTSIVFFVAVIDPLPDKSGETSLRSQNSANSNKLSSHKRVNDSANSIAVQQFRLGHPQQNIHKLQLIRNFAARIMTGKRKYDHMSSLIKGLGWMMVQTTFIYRDMVLICKCKKDLAPKYLSSKLSQRSQVHRYRTREHDDLNVARCRRPWRKELSSFALQNFGNL